MAGGRTPRADGGPSTRAMSTAPPSLLFSRRMPDCRGRPPDPIVPQQTEVYAPLRRDAAGDRPRSSPPARLSSHPPVAPARPKPGAATNQTPGHRLPGHRLPEGRIRQLADWRSQDQAAPADFAPNGLTCSHMDLGGSGSSASDPSESLGTSNPSSSRSPSTMSGRSTRVPSQPSR